jgi:excinuclease ABC subunit B
MAEDLTDYYSRVGVKVRYLHSEIDTLERVEIIDDLRRGEFDCLVGVNLLREGLDLPEVSLVAILDADKEGFLRSETSLIQTIGRAARNVNGEVLIYADRLTDSVMAAVETTNRRRKLQMEYNRRHGIKPRSTRRTLREKKDVEELKVDEIPDHELELIIKDLEAEMRDAARNLEFERAARIRDRIMSLKSN